MEILCIPAILGGCSPLVTFQVYFAQIKTYPVMYYYYPNFWTFFQEIPYYVFGRMAIGGTLICLILEGILLLLKEKIIDAGNLIADCCFMMMTMLCFLPCMHERYGYGLEVLAIVYAVTEKRKWWFPLILQGITFITYAPVWYGSYLLKDAWSLAAAYLVTFIVFVYGRIRELLKVEGEKAHV
jgi:hypothetical protein